MVESSRPDCKPKDWIAFWTQKKGPDRASPPGASLSPDPVSEPDGDPSHHAGGRVLDRQLVEEAPLGHLVEEVAHREQQIPVGPRQGLEEGKPLGDLHVESRGGDGTVEPLEEAEISMVYRPASFIAGCVISLLALVLSVLLLVGFKERKPD